MIRAVIVGFALLVSTPALAEESPSLDETLSWLAQELPEMGGRPADAKEAAKDAPNVLYIHPRFDAKSCELTVVEWTFSGPADARKGIRQEMTIPLGALRTEVELRVGGTGHAELAFQTRGRKKALTIYFEQKLGNKFSHKSGATAAWRLLDHDAGHAQRIQKALEHAIELCSGGGNETKKPSNEPF